MDGVNECRLWVRTSLKSVRSRKRLKALSSGRFNRLNLPREPFLLCHCEHQVDHAIGIAPLVVVPRNNLEEVGVELDSGAGVEDAGARVTQEIGRNDLFVGVAQEAF